VGTDPFDPLDPRSPFVGFAPSFVLTFLTAAGGPIFVPRRPDNLNEDWKRHDGGTTG
jgi:hypothetical protein